jgi:Flp pilus assembly protein TadB
MENNRATIEAKRRNLGFFFITLLITLAAAVIYQYLVSSFMNYLIVGLIAASVNIVLYYGLTYKKRIKREGEFYDNNIVLIVGGLTLVIPYFIFSRYFHWHCRDSRFHFSF